MSERIAEILVLLAMEVEVLEEEVAGQNHHQKSLELVTLEAFPVFLGFVAVAGVSAAAFVETAAVVTAEIVGTAVFAIVATFVEMQLSVADIAHSSS